MIALPTISRTQRRARLALTAAILTGVAATSITWGFAPAALADAPDDGSDSSIRTTRLVLDHAVSLPDAKLASMRSDRAVLGYRYSNPGVVGEYYETPELPSETFLEIFRDRFGTEPRITELIVAADHSTDARWGGGESAVGMEANQLPAAEALTQDLPNFTPAVVGDGTAWTELVAGRPDTHSAASVASTDRRNQVEDSTSAAVPATELAQDWRPSTVQLSSSGWRSSSPMVGLSTYDYWIHRPGGALAGEDFDGVPQNWGVEFRIQLNNTAIESSDGSSLRTPTRNGICPNTPNVRNQFWAKNGTFTSWSVWHIGSQTLDEIGAYADTNDQTSPCSAQTFSIGIAYPAAVKRTPNGNVEFGTEIYTAPGAVNSNLITSTIEAVEAYSCDVFPYTVPDTNCMGTDTTRPWPVSNFPKSWTVLPRTGAATQASPTTPTPVYTTDGGFPQSCVTANRGKTPLRFCSAS